MSAEVGQMSVEQLVGSSLPVFIGITVVLFGGAAWMAGRAIALSWKSRWLVLPYGLLLGVGARFITFSLFEGRLLSISGYVISTLVVVLLMLMAHRVYQVRQMVRQYPWMVEPSWWFAWREKTSSSDET